MKDNRGRPTRYLTENEFRTLKALFSNGIPLGDALAEIQMPHSVYNSRVRDAMLDANKPKKELSAAKKRNIKYIFELLKARGQHAQTLVERLDLGDAKNIRWLLATLYPDVYSQRVSEDRSLKTAEIQVYDEPSAAQQQASDLLAEGDTPNVPGLDEE